MLLVIKYTILFLLQYFARIEVCDMVSSSHARSRKSGVSTGPYRVLQVVQGLLMRGVILDYCLAGSSMARSVAVFDSCLAYLGTAAIGEGMAPGEGGVAQMGS